MKMKKLGLLLAGALFATSLFAQASKQPEIEAKEELKAPVSEEMGWSMKQVSFFMTIYPIVAAVCSPFAGRVFNKYAKTNVILAIVAGVWCLTYIWSSTYTQLWQWTVYGVITGVLGDRFSVTVLGVELKGQNVGVGFLVVLFAVGFVLFCKADKMNKDRKAELAARK